MRVSIRDHRSAARDVGFTLVELLVFMMLLVVVLVVVGGLLASSLSGEHTVRSRTEATNLGQILTQSVQKGVRNAAAIELRTPLPGTQLLTVRTAGSDTALTWACQSWFYSPVDGGSVFTKRVSPAGPIATPTTNEPGGWTLLGSGIKPGDLAVFNAPVGRVDIDFTVAAQGSTAVDISTSIYQRQPAIGSAPCF
jgi:type II secretory pathway pseudopilin PulG